MHPIGDPRSQPSDLGRPLPESPHAVSVCLPTWSDNVGYEEQEPRVVEALQSGYPRFVVPNVVREMFDRAARDLAETSETLFVFPSQKVASRARDYAALQTGIEGRVIPWGADGLHAAVIDKHAGEQLRQYWQHTGEIVSSRLAEAVLDDRPITFALDRDLERSLRERVAGYAQADPEDVLLYPTGMAAFHAAFRAFRRLAPDLPSLQYGFPYVDILKIQQRLGSGVHFFPQDTESDLQKAIHLLETEPCGGLYCEFPGNPLLSSPELDAFSRITQQRGIPFLIDDTLGAIINSDVLHLCDVTATSLTKYFSGVGDVMAGCLVLNPERPAHSQLRQILESDHESLLLAEDAEVLERNSRDVAERVTRINATAAFLCHWLNSHPAVARIEYPLFRDSDRYRRYCRDSAGAGGLFSIILKNEAETAPRFFDQLNLNKGPNLGTNFTLCCPYTILAHYEELDFAARCGVSQFLIRVSVGLESADWLQQQFKHALDSL